PTKITREDGSYVELKYDDSLRLEKETYYDANGVQEEEIAYSYDAEGNRQTVSSGEAQGSYDYENIHQLTQIDTSEGLETYHYDDGGRLETITREGETWHLRYNTDDLIIEVKKGENIVVQYAYDSAGRRVEMTDGTGEKDYVVAPLMGEGLESPHLVMDGANDPLAAYVYAGNMPLMRLDEQGNPTYYLEDGMGSIVGLANNSGVEVAEFEYDSFGNLRNNPTGMPNELGGDFRFQGQWLESNTAFYHFRARYYDPETGRFVSRDPVDIIETEPESSNPYQFVYNNPHVYSDPTGQFTLNEIQIRNKIEGILNSIKHEATTQLKEELYNQAKGTVSNILEGFLKKYAPPYSFFADHYKILKDDQGGGTVLEKLVKDTVCDLLGDSSAKDNIYLGPDILQSGKAIRNGRNCNGDFLSPGITKPDGTPDPDFVISNPTPIDAYQARERSWLIGDFKLSVASISTALNKPNTNSHRQWRAIKNYALKSQYIPLATYVTFYSPKKDVYLKELERQALTDFQVKLFIVPLTRIRGS
ncbi:MULTISPECIES: RHS repeat-associated core domain-containing protein, partial [Spirulina sp. CCY15215]|uniref:RHS repeat domain-containing protein n=1 Tax=Spirulina sp. CCY15215 TaxID=2767591 RepID=UPI00194EBF63